MFRLPSNHLHSSYYLSLKKIIMSTNIREHTASIWEWSDGEAPLVVCINHQPPLPPPPPPHSKTNSDLRRTAGGVDAPQHNSAYSSIPGKSRQSEWPIWCCRDASLLLWTCHYLKQGSPSNSPLCCITHLRTYQILPCLNVINFSLDLTQISGVCRRERVSRQT
jgi:hypothetical protein